MACGSIALAQETPDKKAPNVTDMETIKALLKPWSWEDIWTCASRVRGTNLGMLRNKWKKPNERQLACVRILLAPGNHSNRIHRAALAAQGRLHEEEAQACL